MTDAPDPPNAEWNTQARGETPTQQLDRNWLGLLQELRVEQTGVQLLTGFLLTLPFQQRFDDVSAFGLAVYLVTVSASIIATILLIAPVGMHRILFRHKEVGVLVRVGNRLAIAGLFMLGIALVGVVALTFDFVVGPLVGIAAALVALSLLLALWVALPRWYLKSR
ncbi:sodium:proton antiporter [Rhodococcus sp. 06-462-5]|uniref:DUF6328 family protein n=1 Tax=unclassified Rhodococcus (in: high G+C Gram-positive bacteria) TaxID=192944 RepID=UPI000B9BC3F1|nr:MULTISPECIES: DUF6328 family protein [unclassified Rhodococcus (in: high G+C Gram-positive bacteria)]OZC66602.1 sodium:proton antiporter [Rhodococcus sp. 06-462-5]OZE68816.1 sodium:proton antiporter [Rhodococcus sp. 02-925g]